MGRPTPPSRAAPPLLEAAPSSRSPRRRLNQHQHQHPCLTLARYPTCHSARSARSALCRPLAWREKLENPWACKTSCPWAVTRSWTTAASWVLAPVRPQGHDKLAVRRLKPYGRVNSNQAARRAVEMLLPTAVSRHYSPTRTRHRPVVARRCPSRRRVRPAHHRRPLQWYRPAQAIKATEG